MLVCAIFFPGQNPQLADQILFCPDVSAERFQKIFQALSLKSTSKLLMLIEMQGSDKTCDNMYLVTFTIIHVRVFDTFWSMGQIGSTMVSACAIGNTFEPIN